MSVKRVFLQVVFVLAALLIGSLYLFAQPAPPEVTQAHQLFQTRDYDGAIKLLEAFIQRNPTTTFGWTLLGNAYRQKGNLDKALEMHLKAASFRPSRWPDTFNAAVIYALKSDKDKAFEMLQALRSGGSFDMDLVQTNNDLASLHSDPRFAKLRWKPEDFANPFVENVKVIHEWAGENKNDQFGWIARSIGDVDGDGVIDLLITSARSNVKGYRSGRVFVISGKTAAG
jgi:tetratricopeptide (TPR) repeat protein